MREPIGKPGRLPAAESADQVRKEAIAEALKAFTAEMKLVDVTDLIAYVRTDKHANISDLITSSAELFFKDGTLRYGMGADVELDWDTTPTVSLDLEFYNMGVWVYFTLVLRAPDNALNVSYIEFTDTPDKKAAEAVLPQTNTQRLLEALQNARL